MPGSSRLDLGTAVAVLGLVAGCTYFVGEKLSRVYLALEAASEWGSWYVVLMSLLYCLEAAFAAITRGLRTSSQASTTRSYALRTFCAASWYSATGL